MSAFSVSDAKAKLPSLIDRALDGEPVVITRHGKPVVELRSVAHVPVPREVAAAWDCWMRARRDARKSVGPTSVELLSAVYEDE